MPTVSRYTAMQELRRAQKRLRDATLSRDVRAYGEAQKDIRYWKQYRSQISTRRTT
jgi:hypothetical protein